jgi:hypothetical protein
VETWTESDYEELSWHDCHTHGFTIVEREYGCGDLVLDIDFITEWKVEDDRSLSFLVAPATLTFHDIWDLVIELDYKSAQSGMMPFSIDGLAREPLELEHDASQTKFCYQMDVNWPYGSISFKGHRFKQTLRAEPIETSSQSLEPSERVPISGGG